MIETYLDQLLVALRGGARDVRRVLAEVEEHLRDAAEEGERAGLSPADAEAAAVARFGSPKSVARRFASPGVGWLPAPVLRDGVNALMTLAIVGLLAIGASGVLAIGARAAFGARFVAGDPTGVTYTPARCKDYEEYAPSAQNCETAAAAHHADEVGTYRVAAGVLGLLVLAGRAVMRRRRPGADAATDVALPDGMVPAVAATMFGLAGGLLLVQGVGLMVSSPSLTAQGPGQWLTAGVVALAVAAYYAVALLRTLRVRVA